jgi:recombination protein RecR
MKGYSPSLQRLLQELVRLPGIGPRTAERLALFLVQAPALAETLADALREVAHRVRRCERCFNWTEAGPICEICQDPHRNAELLCVVEQPRDVVALESSGAYRGLYHVLGGRIAPLEGIQPEDLSLEALRRRVEKERFQEVILATSPTTEGDMTAAYVADLLQGTGVRLSRLARGVVPGSTLEIATAEMLASALEDRRPLLRTTAAQERKG